MGTCTCIINKGHCALHLKYLGSWNVSVCLCVRVRVCICEHVLIWGKVKECRRWWAAANQSCFLRMELPEQWQLLRGACDSSLWDNFRSRAARGDVEIMGQERRKEEKIKCDTMATTAGPTQYGRIWPGSSKDKRESSCVSCITTLFRRHPNHNPLSRQDISSGRTT